MIDPHFFLYPMAGMFFLTLMVLLLLTRARLKSMEKGDVEPDHYLHHPVTALEPVANRVLSRHFSNLFETPVLFYTVCLAIMICDVTSVALLALAWAYVGVRALHAAVHILGDSLTLRARV